MAFNFWNGVIQLPHMQNDAACVASVEGQGQVAPSRPVLDPTFPARYFGARRRADSPQCAPAVGAASEWVSDSISFVGVGGLIPPLHLIPSSSRSSSTNEVPSDSRQFGLLY